MIILFCKKNPTSRITKKSRGIAPLKTDVWRENSEKQDDFLKSSFFDLQKLKKFREISPSRNLQKSKGNTASKTDIWKENHIKIVDRLKRQRQISNDKHNYNPPSFKKVS